ncbi:Synaptotagmin-15 [Taenia solium]|eukprot:TsM_000091700 transcript=TsM_000091700 gene=TsM_000091700
MLQTIRSRVVEGWRSLPLPASAPTPSFKRQSTVESTSSIREMDSPSSWSTPIKYRPSAFAKSRELGRLDPNLYLSETNEDLYDVPIDHLGRVWFTISYDETAEQLRITIHKARNLRSPRYQSFRSSSAIISNDVTSLSLLTPAPTQDCRIRVYVENSEKKFHTTSIKKQTNNPTFEESFTFQLPKRELANHNIRLDVLSIEKTKRTLLIGFVTFPLTILARTESERRPIRVAKDLQLDDGSNSPGNILLVVSLTYFPSADRLTVGLFECHNLPLKATGLPISVYAKVMACQGIQGKMLKTKRTELLDQRESFNESFTFSKLGDPCNIHVRIIITQPGFFDKPVAILVLGSDMVAKGSGMSHWNAMIERPEATITECHEMQSL